MEIEFNVNVSLTKQLLEERGRHLSVIIECQTKEKALRLKEWLGPDRPEFEEEINDDEAGWLELMELWPFADVSDVNNYTIEATWVDQAMKAESLVRVNEFTSVEVVALFLIPEYAGWGDGLEYDGQNEEDGFYLVNRSGVFSVVSQRNRLLPNGYELRYGSDYTTDLEELWKARVKTEA